MVIFSYHVTGLRLTTDSSQSTPIESISAIAGEPPLENRHAIVCIKKFLCAKSFNTPYVEKFLSNEYLNSFIQRQSKNKPLFIRILEKWSYSRIFNIPTYTYRHTNFHPWRVRNLKIDLKLTRKKRALLLITRPEYF